MTTLLLVILVLALIGALPQLGVSSYGYGPPGLIGVVLVVLLVLVLTGRL